jgi:hypothetical protein
MMRKASTCMASLGLGIGLLAGLPAAASAVPTVTLKAAAVPIPVNPAKPHGPTYPGTGNILGAGTALETEIHISGNEYGGGPPPLREVKFYAPAGAKLHTQGFATCSPTTLQNYGPEKCPKKSFASPLGEAMGYVTLGGERVHETVSVQGFFAPGGALAFYVLGRTPVSIEIVSTGNITNGGGPFGPLLTAEVPLIPSVPGALDATAEFIKVKVGAAYKKGKKLISYATVPKKCPKGGFPVKAELSFGTGESRSEWVTAPAATYTAPCPKKKK